MRSKQGETNTRWLDRETGNPFVVLAAEEGTVLLASVNAPEVCSVNTENFCMRFAPALPDLDSSKGNR